MCIRDSTMGALALTSKEAYRTPFAPLPGQVTFVPFGDAEAVSYTHLTLPTSDLV